MHKTAAFILTLCLAFPAVPAAQQSRSTTRKTSRPSKKSATKKSTTRKSTAGSAARKSGASKKTASGKKSRRPVKKRQSWRSGQMRPAPERYKEIQQALIDKGYLGGPATGVWGTDSTEALRRFQEDQNLEPTGKLDSLTLITLGLGPKRDLSASATSSGSASSSRGPQ